MPKHVSIIGHVQAEADEYTGPEREVTVDVSNWRLRVHDGVTPGGTVVPKMTDVTSAVQVLASQTEDALEAISAQITGEGSLTEELAALADVVAGKAASDHAHTIEDISGGDPEESIIAALLAATTPEEVVTILGLGDVAIENVVPIEKGGTGATTASAALAALGVTIGTDPGDLAPLGANSRLARSVMAYNLGQWDEGANITGDATLTAADSVGFLRVATNADSATVTLPSIAAAALGEIIIYRYGAGAVNIVRAGSDVIEDGLTSISVPNQFDILILRATEDRWKVAAYMPYSATPLLQPLPTASQAEAEAGSSNTTLMTPLRVAQAINSLAVSGVGVDQTWQSVAGSRSTNTSYQNTTGKPIMVAAVADDIPEGAAGGFDVSPDNSTWVGVGLVGFSYFVVPDGWYYRRLGVITTSYPWAELR